MPTSEPPSVALGRLAVELPRRLAAVGSPASSSLQSYVREAAALCDQDATLCAQVATLGTTRLGHDLSMISPSLESSLRRLFLAQQHGIELQTQGGGGGEEVECDG